MKGKILRSGLFGFKKADVLNYIASLDERAEKKLAEKQQEVDRLKKELDGIETELADARKNRDAIVAVLEAAQKNAKEIIENAKAAADEIESRAKNTAEAEKNNLNREIEIKKREINNQFLSEERKISTLKKEIEGLRMTSLKSIKKFEQDLFNIEQVLSQKESYTETSRMKQDKLSEKQFFDSVRTVPIRVVKSDVAEKQA